MPASLDGIDIRPSEEGAEFPEDQEASVDRFLSVIIESADPVGNVFAAINRPHMLTLPKSEYEVKGISAYRGSLWETGSQERLPVSRGNAEFLMI